MKRIIQNQGIIHSHLVWFGRLPPTPNNTVVLKLKSFQNKTCFFVVQSMENQSVFLYFNHTMATRLIRIAPLVVHFAVESLKANKWAHRYFAFSTLCAHFYSLKVDFANFSFSTRCTFHAMQQGQMEPFLVVCTPVHFQHQNWLSVSVVRPKHVCRCAVAHRTKCGECLKRHFSILA